MNKESKYDEFGVLKTTPWEDIKKNDFVKYTSTKIVKNEKTGHTELIKFDLFGVWDGEKVEFKDKEKHVVRTTRWLKKQ